MKFDDYFYDQGNVLRNKLEIHNQFLLEEYANRFAALGMQDLMKEPVPKRLDGDYLRRVHGTLFGDVYDWAGQYRECSMGRNMDFCPPEKIPERVDAFMADFRKGFLESRIEEPVLGDVLAMSWGSLNSIHPFRDGNGRSQTMFFLKACDAKGYDLIFSDKDIRNLRIARDEASAGRTGLLSGILSRSLVKQPEPVPMRPFERLKLTLASLWGDGMGRGGNEGPDLH